MQAAAGLKARSCLIDGKAVCCDEKGIAVFALLRYRERPAEILLYAFDLLELDGQDLPREGVPLHHCISQWGFRPVESSRSCVQALLELFAARGIHRGSDRLDFTVLARLISAMPDALDKHQAGEWPCRAR